MTYNNCVQSILSELSAFPLEWAEKIACNICKLINTEDECNPSIIDCEPYRACETLTSLSNFQVSDDTVCITYKDERGVNVKRCFLLSKFTDEINETDGTCITSQWGILSPKDKWQSIIDKICYCCNPTTTTTTTSTTTTTTIVPCTDCWTLLITNPTLSDSSFSYTDCGDSPFIVAVPAGTNYKFCACPDNVTYNSSELTLTIVSTNCITCDACNQYTINNSNAYPIEIPYTDCSSLSSASIWILSGEIGIVECACTDSIVLPIGTYITKTSDCPIPVCKCYRLSNTTGIDILANYTDCGNISQVINVSTEYAYTCALEGTIVGVGLIIEEFLPNCIDVCGPITTTSTTTTSSTTTTTTIAPTITTTSTTTTTTLAVENDIVYFTNSSTNMDRGAKIWFSQQDYYTPNTPGDLVPANCLSIPDLGTAPVITVTVRFWKDDIYNTIDDGFALVRGEDGNKTVTISSDLLTYNGSTGAWQIANGIFTLEEGTNIAAFEITAVTASYTYAGVQHNFSLPPANHFIRTHNTFNAGGTPVIWFDL